MLARSAFVGSATGDGSHGFRACPLPGEAPLLPVRPRFRKAVPDEARVPGPIPFFKEIKLEDQ